MIRQWFWYIPEAATLSKPYDQSRKDFIKTSEIMTKSRLYNKSEIKKVYRAVFDLPGTGSIANYGIK